MSPPNKVPAGQHAAAAFANQMMQLAAQLNILLAQTQPGTPPDDAFLAQASQALSEMSACQKMLETLRPQVTNTAPQPQMAESWVESFATFERGTTQADFDAAWKGTAKSVSDQPAKKPVGKPFTHLALHRSLVGAGFTAPGTQPTKGVLLTGDADIRKAFIDDTGAGPVVLRNQKAGAPVPHVVQFYPIDDAPHLFLDVAHRVERELQFAGACGHTVLIIHDLNEIAPHRGSAEDGAIEALHKGLDKLQDLDVSIVAIAKNPEGVCPTVRQRFAAWHMRQPLRARL